MAEKMKATKPASKRKLAKTETDDATPKKQKTTGKDVCGQEISEVLSFYQERRKNAVPEGKEFKFNKNRVKMISATKEIPENCKGVLYWMFRDQRVQDNWALLWAQRLATKQEVPLLVAFCLPPSYLDATMRQYKFMIKGLQLLEKELQELNIPFHVLLGEAPKVLPNFVDANNIGAVVADFLPLRKPMHWLDDLSKKLKKNIALCQVDAHNIVPCWNASDKQEYAARTIRPKITKKLAEFLTEYPPVIKHPHKVSKAASKPVDWKSVMEFIDVDEKVADVDWAKPGTAEGLKMLETFVNKRLQGFGTDRNDPTKSALSNLSPWFHTGQISAQRAALRVREFRGKHSESVAGYLEELIIRRELADNFCFYNSENYDSLKGGYAWAQKTLDDHRNDEREKIYTKEQLENAMTYDKLWNGAQRQLVKEGKMHGFLRMYWAKKILEWTRSPEDGLAISIYLNDKYALDGLDPNGYVGCMWSIVGIHDQGWRERPVFGKIRYMNYQGCKRKFDVAAFERRYSGDKK